jgi:cation diffusion facilitator CzcD-associated flavoprotein CzcO
VGQAQPRSRSCQRGVGEVSASLSGRDCGEGFVTPTPDAIIVGAGPAGLACAMTMRAAGLDVMVLEKAGQVGAVWRRHYDRLHLHTDRNHSGLPGMPMPSDYPAYPSRAQMVSYLENYAACFQIKPGFNTKVLRLRRHGARWLADTSLVATGIADAPYRPSWPGMDIYSGVVVHSSNYRNPQTFSGRRALVIGFGNSGGEIALDLANAGVDVTLAVRSPVQIISAPSFSQPASAPICAGWFLMSRACSTAAACRWSREQRPLYRGSTSAARSRCPPGSCGKSASRRSG